VNARHVEYGKKFSEESKETRLLLVTKNLKSDHLYWGYFRHFVFSGCQAAFYAVLWGRFC
jgi:hypothetical protein